MSELTEVWVVEHGDYENAYTEGAVAYLAHPEHGYMGIGAGNYTIRRQREQADEIRLVAD